MTFPPIVSWHDNEWSELSGTTDPRALTASNRSQGEPFALTKPTRASTPPTPSIFELRKMSSCKNRDWKGISRKLEGSILHSRHLSTRTLLCSLQVAVKDVVPVRPSEQSRQNQHSRLEQRSHSHRGPRMSLTQHQEDTTRDQAQQVPRTVTGSDVVAEIATRMRDGLQSKTL